MTTQPTRLHVVTGKGGTGKTTVAAAIALALESRGQKVLLCEVEGRQGLARLFDVPPLPYEERSIAVGEGGGEVFALAIDAEAALLEYLDMYYKLGRAGKALDRFGVIDFATTIAPGLRDVLVTGKVYEAARRRGKDKHRTYDAIVLDAPPTGRITRFLNVNEEVVGLAKVGPIRNQAANIMTLMRSRRTQVHIVTLLEEMPVQETIDAIGELGAAALPVGTIFVNQVRTSPFEAEAESAVRTDDIDPAVVAKEMASAGVDVEPETAEALVGQGREHLERVELERRQRAELDELGRPVVELPAVPDGIELGEVHELAALIEPELR